MSFRYTFLPNSADSSISFKNLADEFDYAEPALVSDATYAGSSLPFQTDYWSGICFGDNGNYAYFATNNRSYIYMYSLDVQYDALNNRTQVGFIDISAQETDVQGIAFSNDGLKLFVVGSTLGVSEWTLNVEWDITQGVTYSGNAIDMSIAPMLENSPVDISFRPDGKEIYVLGSTNDAVYVFQLANEFDLSTYHYVGTTEIRDQNGAKLTDDVSGITFNSTGRIMYIAGTIPDNFGDTIVAEFRCEKSYDPISASYTGNSVTFNLPVEAGSAVYSPFKKVIVIGRFSLQILQINLSSGNTEDNINLGDFYRGGDFVPYLTGTAIANIPTQADQTRIDLLNTTPEQSASLSRPTLNLDFSRGGKHLYTNSGRDSNDALLYSYQLDSAFNLSSLVLNEGDSTDISGDLALGGLAIGFVQDSAWDKFSHDSLGVGDSYPVSLDDLTRWETDSDPLRIVKFNDKSKTYAGAISPSVYRNYHLISTLSTETYGHGAIGLILAYNEVESDGFLYENTLSVIRRPALPGDSTEVVYGEITFLPTTSVGDELYTTHTWTVPAGVNYISAIAVGAGGGARGSLNSPSLGFQGGEGGGGGACAQGYLSVVPGQTLTIRAGNGGRGVSSTVVGQPGNDGGESAILSGGYLLRAEGGKASTGSSSRVGGAGGGSINSVGDIIEAGGRGGNGIYSSTSSFNTQGGGGGGAGGYAGDGGYGGYQTVPGRAGQGGAGGGGATGFDERYGGGGLGLLGIGRSGEAAAFSGGGGGSGGSDGNSTIGTGGAHGGGGGASGGYVNSTGGNGAGGAVRIVYGYGRAYPATNLEDGFSGQDVTTYSPFSVVYNYKQNDQKIIKQVTNISADSDNWFNNECVLDVTRDSNDFTITSTAIENNPATAIETLTLSLDSDPVLAQFSGEKKIGFSNYDVLSPIWSDFRFNDVNLGDPNAYRHEFGGIASDAGGTKIFTSVNTYEKGSPDILVASEILQYSLPNEKSVANAQVTPYQITQYSLTKQTSFREVYGIAVGPDSNGFDGKKLFVIMKNTDPNVDGIIQQYELNASWDISTASLSKELTIGGHSNSFTLKSLQFTNEGKTLLVAGESGIIKLFDLATAYDIATATFDSIDPRSQINLGLDEISGMFSDELKDIYISGKSGASEQLYKFQNNSFQPISLSDFRMPLTEFINLDFSNQTILFDDGTNVGVPGWTATRTQIRLGNSSIGGFTTPTDPTPNPVGSQSRVSPGDGTLDPSMDYYVEFLTLDGRTCVRLYNSGQVSTAGDVSHGPYVISNNYVLIEAGSTVTFEWRAAAGDDAYDVFAYLLKDDGQTQILLNETQGGVSGDTGWLTVSSTVNLAGNYKFVFVAGTFDYTFGSVAGASLYVTNISIT